MWNGLVTEELRDLSLQYANKFRGACPDEYEDIDYDDITYAISPTKVYILIGTISTSIRQISE